MRTNPVMTSYVRIRVFSGEKKALKEMARENGTTLSNLIRSSVLSDRENESRKVR